MKAKTKKAPKGSRKAQKAPQDPGSGKKAGSAARTPQGAPQRGRKQPELPGTQTPKTPAQNAYESWIDCLEQESVISERSRKRKEDLIIVMKRDKVNVVACLDGSGKKRKHRLQLHDKLVVTK